jgi:MoaA/NifB/PqqE/SkfB family radical SAM enzyme
MRVYEKPLIKVNAELEDGKVVMDTEGVLSTPAKPIISRINRIFREEKPVYFDDETLIFSTWAPPVPGEAFNRMISAEIAAIMKKRVPDQFSIGITGRCPNHCIHCGAAGFATGQELPADVIVDTIKQAIDMGSYLVAFDGGETMVRNDIVDMVGQVHSPKSITTCFTSGFGLTPERAHALKAAGMYALRISLDSPEEAEHDRIRGRKGAFMDTINGIRNSLEAGILTDLFVVVSPHNIDDLEDFYSTAADLGVHEMSIYEIIAVGKWLDHEDEVISQKDVSRLEKFQKAKNTQEEGPRVTAFPYFMGPDMFGCFAGRRWMHVSPAGEVIPCAYTPLSFGNVQEEKLETIWKRMGKHPAYRSGAEYCMMRDPEFRKRYIHTIPEDAVLPMRVR